MEVLPAILLIYSLTTRGELLYSAPMPSLAYCRHIARQVKEDRWPICVQQGWPLIDNTDHRSRPKE